MIAVRYLPFLPLLLLLHPPAAARLDSSLLAFDGTNPEILPARLSLTGLYDEVSSPRRAATSGIVPFEVNTPLWSDGARKERFITLPPGAKVAPTDTDRYAFPDRTVLVKNFLIDSVHADSATRFYIETRFLIIRQSPFGSQYLGLSYKWRRDQSDADLVDPGTGLDTVHRVRWNGAARGKRWRYPSQGDCTACHFNRGVLGFITPQLNRPSRGNPALNQLQALVTAGILSANPLAGKPAPTFRWADPAETGGTPPAGLSLLEWKARSYLASNCSQCHGNRNAHTFETASHDFDFLHPGRKIAYAIPDTLGGFVGKPTVEEPRFPQLVFPGYPESSFVAARMLSRPSGFGGSSLQMPPLATYQPDSAATALLRDWICSLGIRGTACRLPALQADSTYWASAGLHAGLRGRSAAGALQARLRGPYLSVTGGSAGEPALSDLRGREIRLEKVGPGLYRVICQLPQGLYLLRAGGAIAKIHQAVRP